MSNSSKRKRGAGPRAASKSNRRDATTSTGGFNTKAWLVRGGIAAAVVVIIALIVVNQPQDLGPPDSVESFTVTDRTHLEGQVAYAQDPPVGGAHNPVWQECGYYGAPIASENAVHALEHGAVWITYRPDLDADAVETLRGFARQTEVLVSPYPGQEDPVVAASWGNQIRLTGADDPDLEAFVVNFKNHNDAPEIQAGCNDGRGVGGSGGGSHSG